MSGLVKHFYPFIILLAIHFNGCTKTKIGNYTLVIEGAVYSVTRNAYCCDTAGTYKLENYYFENDVKVTQVSNSTIEIEDEIWKKDGASINYDNSYDSNNQSGHPLGGGYRYTESYTGKILSDKLIVGDYKKEDFSYVSFSKTYKSTIHAKFTIKKN